MPTEKDVKAKDLAEAQFIRVADEVDVSTVTSVPIRDIVTLNSALPDLGLLGFTQQELSLLREVISCYPQLNLDDNRTNNIQNLLQKVEEVIDASNNRRNSSNAGGLGTKWFTLGGEIKVETMAPRGTQTTSGGGKVEFVVNSLYPLYLPLIVSKRLRSMTQGRAFKIDEGMNFFFINGSMGIELYVKNASGTLTYVTTIKRSELEVLNAIFLEQAEQYIGFNSKTFKVEETETPTAGE